MKRKSIQWRLSISYAGIALLATLLLGAIMLVTLQQYYATRERDYLTENAVSISQIVVDLQRGNASAEDIGHLLGSFAFFSNTRITLFGPEEEILYDTGSPQGRTYFSMESYTESGFLPAGTGFVIETVAEPGDIAEGGAVNLGEGVIVLEESAGGFPGWMITAPMDDIVNAIEVRSNQVVEYPILDEDGSRSGTLQLTEGPAYGRDILRSVAWGWGISALVAVVLAAMGGWLVSRQFSSPLESLTRTTSKMTDGDLTARSEINRPDEFGQLANSYNLMADSVEAKVTALQRFVADAAHQLGTPLTALRTNLELVEDEQVPAVLDQVQRIDELTSGLLALSQLEATDSKFEPVDAAELLKEFSEPFASRAEQAEVGFKVEIIGDGHVIKGDKDQLGVLMENLIDNAIKFTPAGGEVEVKLQSEEYGLTFVVEDTGIGILEEDMQELFSRFHRGRNAAGYQGSGLGLAIVRVIADRHGAEIEVTRKSEGTVFKVRFINR